jgi:nucleotide-binding universal stress UspA family protein
MKIILSTDFSEENSMLFPYAIDLMKVTGGEILLFHAYMDQILMGDSSFPGGLDADTFFNRELLAEMEKQAEIFMAEKRKILEDEIGSQKISGITITTVLKGGDPEQELLVLTENEKPDLILMGTSGKGHKGFLEGSIAKSIMAKVNVPVLAIPVGYQWTPGSQIMYANNFSQFEVLTLNQLIELTSLYHPVIHVVHFLLDDNDSKAFLLMEELRQAFKMEEAKYQIRFELIRTDSAREAMKLFCEQHHISMAAFIAHKRTWLDSIFKDKVGKDDFFNLGIPMLTFRLPE